MNYKKEWEKMYETAQRSFKEHRATLIQDSDRFTIIDWRKANGSSDYYINFIVDKHRGSLIVGGDLGDSIATWYNQITISDLKRYIYRDIGYYMKKFRCSSDDYCYDTDEVLESLIEDLFGAEEDSEEIIKDYITTSDFDSFEEFKEELEHEIDNSIHDNKFYPTERLYDMVTDVYPDAWEAFISCGRKIAGRVYLWAIGFKMACDQLGL